MTDRHEVFISLDIEASGPMPPDFSMLSIGAVCVDDDQREFYRELKPISDRFDPGALKVTGFDLEALKRTGVDPVAAISELSAWVTEMAGPGGRPIMVGFNAPFDWAFVNYYFLHFLGQNPFGIGAIDIKALYMGATGCSWDETRSSHFPLPRQSERQKHNALADARYQAELFGYARRLRKPSISLP